MAAKNIFICYMCCFVLVIPGAQEPPAPSVNEAMQVRLHEVAVRIIDADGQPVQGLTRDRFHLQVGRNQVDLAYFEEVHTGLKAQGDQPALQGPASSEALVQEDLLPPVKRRVAVILIHAGMLHPRMRARSLAAAHRFVDTQIGDEDRYRIAKLAANKVDLLSPFTSDKKVLHAALDQVGLGSPEGQQLDSTVELAGNMAAAASGYSSSFASSSVGAAAWALHGGDQADMARTTRGFYNALQGLAELMSAADGDKSIVVLSGGLIQTKSGTHETDWLADYLNQRQVSVHSLFMPRFSSDDNFAAQRGPGSAPSRDRGRMLLERLTYQTGDSFQRTHHPDSLDGRLDRIADHINHYYRLGYYSDKPVRNQKVKVDGDPGNWEVLYAHKVGEREDYARLKPEEKQVRIMSDLLFARDDDRRQLDCRWQIGAFKNADGFYVLTALGHLRSPEGGDANLEITMACLSESGQIQAMRHRGVTLAAGDWNLYEQVVSKEMPHRVRFVVHNLETGAKSFYTWAPEPPPVVEDEGFFLSSILVMQKAGRGSVVLTQLSGEPESEGRKKNKRRKSDQAASLAQAGDPLSLGSGLLQGYFCQEVPVGAKVAVFFRLGGQPEEAARYKVYAALAQGGQATPGNLRQLAVQSDAECGHGYLYELDTTGLAVGEYQLAVLCKDLVTGHTQSRQKTIAITSAHANAGWNGN